MVFAMDMASDSRTALDKAISVYGAPAAILRYLPVYSITSDEVASIHARGMAVGAIWNRDQYGAVIGSNDVGRGKAEGEAAAAAWKALGLPPGCAIIYDVEQAFVLSSPAAIGIIEAIHAAGYVPGFYLNPPNGQNHAAGYQEARQATKSIPCVHFSCQTCLNDYKAHSAFVIGEYPNARAVPGYENECIGQQTSLDTYDVDLDVFRDLDLFWHPVPPAVVYPYAAHVITRGSLKVSASHGSTTAIDNQKPPQHVYLERGAAVSVLAEAVKTDDVWIAVALTGDEHEVHGFFLARGLEKD